MTQEDTGPAPHPAESVSRDDDLSPQTRGGLGLKDDLVMALRFFSRLPTGNSTHQTPDLGRIAMALPIAAVIMAVVPVAVLIAGVLGGLPSYFSACLAVAAMVIVGGGMTEDALADAADGLFGGATPERRLAILKDSRHGTYGVAALVLFLALRITALGSLAAINPLAAGAVWLGANVLGRSIGLWMAVALPPARKDGAAASAGALPALRFFVGLALAVLLAVVVSGPATNLVAVGGAVLAAGLIALGWTALCRRLVGGQTGDLIGAGGGLCEIAALTVLLILA